MSVAHTSLGRSTGDLALPELVGRDGLRVIAVRGPGSATAPHPPGQAAPAHEPSHPVASTDMARPAQGAVQPRAAVGTPTAGKERADLLAQGVRIGSVPLARSTLTPSE